MKKSRIIFALAFTFAIVSAFAFKTNSFDGPSYKPTTTCTFGTLQQAGCLPTLNMTPCTIAGVAPAYANHSDCVNAANQLFWQ